MSTNPAAYVDLHYNFGEICPTGKRDARDCQLPNLRAVNLLTAGPD